MEEQTLMCTFRVGRMQLGIDVKRVQEVLREHRMTRVPGAGELICGLMNLRGQIVTAVDLQKRLCLPVDDMECVTNVVVRTTSNPVSLLVHEIGDVIAVNTDCFEPPPETLQGMPRELIRGAYKLDDGLLLALDTDAVLNLVA